MKTAGKNYAEIVRVSIYPAIGIARVGNSTSDYFIGPEIAGMPSADPDGFRDAKGCIKRQASRFRLFGLNKDAAVVCELDGSDGDIGWQVELANHKPAWYYFDQALDISASNGNFDPGTAAIASIRRNRLYKGQRSDLAISPGSRSISGISTNVEGGDPQYSFDTGTFIGTLVYLGELRTDEQGNLLVLGGKGHSFSYDHSLPTTFANNEGWCDDVSDGPVNATIKLKDGRSLSAADGWVVVAPPDYAPGVQAIITGYDLVYSVAASMDPGLSPAQVVFYEHVYPILQRLSVNQWVNAGFSIDFGWGSPADFTLPVLQQLLADPGSASLPLRQAIFERFRDPAAGYLQATAIPEVYGDAVTLSFTTTNPMEWMPVLPIQYAWLKAWAQGNFVPGKPYVPKKWSAMTPVEQAEGLTRAALDQTIGGPFHPGCEFTWPLRNALLYSAPFRLKRRSAPEPDYGDQLSPGAAVGAGGPLDGSLAGSISRWMACPWQTDTASCLSAYRSYSGEYLPTFWPARVPNDVLTEEDYKTIMDGKASVNDKMAAFSSGSRLKWLREIIYNDQNPAQRLTVDTGDTLQHFVNQWDKAGIILNRPGPGGAAFPVRLFVETGRTVTPNTPGPIKTHAFFDYAKKHYGG